VKNIEGNDMKQETKERIGQALTPVLDPFHQVDGCLLREVWESSIQGEIMAIDLEFESGFLSLGVDPNDDTIDIALSPHRREGSERVGTLRPWRKQIGKAFGWGWAGVNQQGYLDGVSLSFGAVTPQFCVTAIASSLRISQHYNVVTRRSGRAGDTGRSPIRLAKTA
jgi:hypothetical protein